MNKNRYYLEKAQNEAKQNYFSANGNEWSASGWADASAEEWSAGGNDWANAAGAALPNPPAVENSEPIIIQVVNNGTSAVNNVTLYDSYNTRTLASPSYGNNANISITSNIINITYQQMLANSEAKPTKVGEVLLVSTSAGQLSQTFQISHKTDTGDVLQKVVSPTQDPYQQLTDRVLVSYKFLLDGFTAIVMNQINAGATLTVYLYPESRFSATQIAAGGNSQLKWANPNIIRGLARPLALPPR